MKNLDTNNLNIYPPAMLELQKVLESTGHEMVLYAGTLLGAIRNNNFINWDDDVDVFVICEGESKIEAIQNFDKTIKPKLLENGYRIDEISWTLKREPRKMLGQYHVIKNNISIDLWVGWIEKNQVYISCVINGDMTKNDIFPLQKIKLNGEFFSIPKNSEKMLQIIYGEDWRTPKRNWKPKVNHWWFQRKILKIIDQYGWAYHFIAQEQQKYSKHIIDYVRLSDFSAQNLEKYDIVYIPSPGISPRKVNSIIKQCKNNYPHVKIIGAYAGENNLTYNYADLIVSISARFLPILKAKYPNNQVIFLPESIDTDFFRPREFRDNTFVVGYAGREAKVKRTYLFEKLDFKVKMKTDHSQEFLVKERTLEPMREFYHSIDCLILLSSSECMPRVVLEAMACGLPVISTDVGSIRLLLNKKQIIPSIPEDLVIKEANKKLKILSKKRNLRKSIGKRNREWIVNNFDWKKNQILWDNVFDALYANDRERIKEMTDNYYNKFSFLREQMNRKILPEDIIANEIPKSPEIVPKKTISFPNKIGIFSHKSKYKIAVCMTTFLRDNLLYDTIQTIVDNFTQEMILLIGDEGNEETVPEEKLEKINYFKTKIPLEYYSLPFFSGISYGRNFLVKKAKEMSIPFCLITADSIQFVHNYNFISAMQFLNSDSNNGIIGFRLLNYPTWRGTINLVPNKYFYIDIPNKEPFNYKELQLIPVDMCSNFFLAKTNVLLENQWDNDLKLMEFEDFWWRLKNNTNYKVFFTSDIIGRYIKIREGNYNQYRKLAYTNFKKLACDKYNIASLTLLSPSFYKYCKK